MNAVSPVETLVTDHLDLWTTALKRKSSAGRGSSSKVELYGIRKLRELILELAVRGLLVPQDPNDEPASELLKKIAAEKARLVKAGKIKKDKALPTIGDEAVPFVAPHGWKWSRIADIGHDFGQKTPDADFTYIDVGAIDNRLGLIDCPAILIAKGAPSRARKLVSRGTVIYSTVRPYLLNVAIVQKDFDPEPIASTAFAVVHPFEGVVSGYVYRYLRSPSFVAYVESVQTGIAYPAINDRQFFSGLIPLPPTAEQHRIVAKVDELMALCDQLEQETEASLGAHQTLVETLLSALTSAADHAQFASAWQCIAGHFETLFATDESIDQLKQTILQLAVMGKLVPQNQNDEPASELLKKIAAEKATLVKEGKIKNHLPVEPMGKSEALPATWVEIVVQDFADIRLGSTPSRTEPRFWNGDIPWVSSGEVADCIIRDTSEKITPEGFKNSSTSMIPARSLLMAIIGQGKTRGQTALLAIDACTNQNVAAFVFNERFAFPEYVWIWAKSKYQSHRDDGHGGAQPALNGKKVRSFRFPLAPIAEQHRIVAKVDELMALCDQLKSRLSDAQTTQLHLADALVAQAIG